MIRPSRFALIVLALLVSYPALAQDRPFEDGYDNELLYVHALVNYAFDLEWQYEWERTQFSGNALRVNTGSVSSDKLLTDIDLTFNEPLNDKWRFVGSFNRDGQRQRPVTQEQLRIGFERTVLSSSAVFVTANPEYDKSSLDVAFGYALYGNDREHYIRVALVMDDLNYGTKNTLGGSQEQDPLYLNWSLRWPLAGDWIAYSEGQVGRGFERRFDDADLSPDLAALAQQDNLAELRVSRRLDDGQLWSFWAEWADFEETRTTRAAAQSYVYSNTEFSLGAEHVRPLSEKHRLRVIARFVDRQAESRGFNGHRFDRQDILGGAFIDRNYGMNALSLGYAFGLPDFEYVADDVTNSYDNSEYTDKVIIGWQHRFSAKAQVRASISHEVSASGFGGGAVQFQMAF